ncbi:MAG: ComEC family competence protein, partial [Verrucomicrobiota bacterium]|nr:ComEC family competence protein [Verrucomicrobiota bacterium]
MRNQPEGTSARVKRWLRRRAERQPFVWIAAAAVGGILLSDRAPFPAVGILLIVVSAAFTFVMRHRLAAYLLIASCFFTLHAWQETSSPGARLARELGDARQAISVVGEVVSEPTNSGNGSASFLLRLKSITRGSLTQPSGATIIAHWRGEVQFGDKLQLFGVLEPIRGPRNPGEFNQQARLSRRDIHDSLVVRYPENGKLLERGGGNRILRAAHASRSWMQHALARGLEDSPEVHGLISAMVLGLREEASDEITEQFQQTGTLHLFAVSGLHVGIVGYLLWAAARALHLPRRGAAALVIPALFFYAAVTGLNTSSLRAALMAAVVLGGLFFDRKVRSGNSLAAAAVIILAIDPNQLFSIGFQLSFAVVAAIVICAGPLLHALLRWCEPDPFLPRSLLSAASRLGLQTWHVIASGASVSLAAWMGSLLLILPYFYLITPVSLFANLVVVPIAFCILAVGLISLVLTLFAPALAVVFNHANWSLASAILAIVGLLSNAPAGH